jgi:ABC-type multidrug transport system ATPase subunit
MGLHPDLTGAENVYFAGQLMGRSKHLIASKMDEIISFSELHDHMNKAVKHYSSGMYLRLAFSIYTLLDSDILLLDEVLSVGDASFRKKSYNKMLDYKDTDKTVILVSHGLTEIENFCDRVIYLDKNVKADNSNIRQVLVHYMNDHPTEKMNSNRDGSNAPGKVGKPLVAVNQHFKIVEMCTTDEKGEKTSAFSSGDSIRFYLKYDKLTNEGDLSFIWKLYDMNDAMLFATSSLFDEGSSTSENTLQNSIIEITTLPKYFLNTGKFYLSLICGVDRRPIATYHYVLTFDVKQDEWMTKESWCDIPAPILHKFDWNRTIES